MKEKPILFSGPMVRQILAGSKTQTRRPVTHHSYGKTEPIPAEYEPRPSTAWPFPLPAGNPEFLSSGRYQAFARPGLGMVALPCPYAGDRLWVRETFSLLGSNGRPPVVYRADTDGERVRVDAPWRPSIHMPRWASRLTLDVLSVRVERVQDISEEDARAEGFEDRADFLHAWALIYGEDALNAWTWVVEFPRAEVPR